MATEYVVNKTAESGSIGADGAIMSANCQIWVSDHPTENKQEVQVYHSAAVTDKWVDYTVADVEFYVNGEAILNEQRSFQNGNKVTTGWTKLGYLDAGTEVTVRSYVHYYQTASKEIKVDTGTQKYTVPSREYTITYDKNNESGTSSFITKTHGDVITLWLTAGSLDGHTFKGWATSPDSTEVEYEPGASYTVNNDVTFYAVWEIDTYTVSYNANGGVKPEALTDQTKTYGVPLTLSLIAPSLTGYNFKGWADSLDNANQGIVNYNPSLNPVYDGNTDLTLYAVWEIVTYTVTYNGNAEGVTDVPANQIKQWNQTLLLTTDVPTLDNYTFKGWSKSENGFALYLPGHQYIDNEDVMLYAVWERTYIKPTIDVLSAVRCKVEEATGYVQVTASWSINTETNGADNQIVSVAVDYKPTNSGIMPMSDNDGWINAVTITEFDNLTSGTVDEIIGDGNISVDSSYYIRVVVTDSDSSTSKQVMIAPEFRIFDVGNAGKSIGFGMPADDDVEGIDVAMNVRFHGNVKLPSFQKVLWKGALQMAWEDNAQHMIYFNEGGDPNATSSTTTISDQQNGIILVFSAYVNNQAVNNTWNFEFIPKEFVNICIDNNCLEGVEDETGMGSTTGVSIMLSDYSMDKVGCKYLYIYDNRIRGHLQNTKTGTTASGITRDNKFWVLRYVLGC